MLSEQVKVQEKKTKDAEPDDKEVKKLEKTVAATKKGVYVTACVADCVFMISGCILFVSVMFPCFVCKLITIAEFESSQANASTVEEQVQK